MAEEIKPLEILVIDDSLSISELFSLFIQRHGSNATSVPDGLEGVNVYKKRLESDKPYDAVLTDLMMRREDGQRADGTFVTEEIKKISPSTQVIVITGVEPTSEYREHFGRAEQLKPDGIVMKPIYLNGMGYILNRIISVKELRNATPDYQPDPFSYQPPPPKLRFQS